MMVASFRIPKRPASIMVAHAQLSTLGAWTAEYVSK